MKTGEGCAGTARRRGCGPPGCGPPLAFGLFCAFLPSWEHLVFLARAPPGAVHNLATLKKAKCGASGNSKPHYL